MRDKLYENLSVFFNLNFTICFGLQIKGNPNWLAS